ncbi:HAD family hydrolase [Alkalicoccus daliensis]|uniref:Phosphoserine phosphatase n=1 Tax=Alkalicoccus daliensis TaxID=745820 RepID=A0A1H0GZC4_9BACI|nr:HAD family hydrolase [Alkalicoccus daliensis]SDO12356.1 putative hydrolase of the HAD superfamily [Alkalicoccus daliensis]
MDKALFFDLDDTILWDAKSIELAFKNTCAYAENTYGTDAKELETAVRAAAKERYSSYDTFAFTQMIGINPFEGLWGSFQDPGEGFERMAAIIEEYQFHTWHDGLKQLGVEEKTAAEELAALFITERKKSPVLFDEAFDVLDQLKGKVTLVLLTNGSPQLQNTKLTITPEIAPYFDHVIISGEFGKGKPDPAIFEHALKVSGASKESTWMIGDNPKTDILGANRAGITSIWLNRFEKEPHPGIEADHEIQDLHQIFNLIDLS